MGTTTNKYHNAKALWLYYFGFLLFTTLIAFPTRKLAEYLEATGFQNMTVVSYITVATLFIGLFLNGIGLIGYNAEISSLEERDIAHAARTLYISPFVNLLIGFVVGISAWVTLRFLSIIVDEVANFAIISIFASIISLRASSIIEKLIFKNSA